MNSHPNAIAGDKALSAPPALVTFLIVAHEAGDYLRDCLASVWAQTYTPVEVVLVDCASTDGAVAAMVRVFAASHPLRVVRSEINLGPSGGAILGLPSCRGDYVARIDADDVAMAERVAWQVEYLQAHPEKDAVGGDVLKISASGLPLRLGLSLRSEFMRRYASKWYVGCFHTTLLVRRSALVARSYNPTLFSSGDHELIEWMARDGRLGLVPRVAGFYRQHGASISRRFDALQKLSGNELRLRLSRAIARPQRRALLAAEDFRFLMHDERLGMALPSRNRHFEEACRRESDWLGAAYFASINSRWLQFGFWIVRASVSGVPWREWLALGLCRTVWPVYLRLTNAGLTILKGFLGTAFRGTLSDSLRVAHVINRLRMWARVGK